MTRNMKKLWRYALTIGICFVCAVMMKVYIDRHLERLQAGQTPSQTPPAEPGSVP